MTDRPTKIDKTDARQGQSGVGVRRVLIGGMVLAIIALVVVFFVLR